MLDRDALQNILSAAGGSQTRTEVETLLEKELQKPESEMDVDLIQEYVLTLEELDGFSYRPLPRTEPPFPKKGNVFRKRRRFRFLRYGAVAACLSILVLLIATASPQFIQPPIPDVSIYGNYAVIRYDQIEDRKLAARPGHELGTRLEEYGMRNVLLPMELNSYTILEMVDNSNEERQRIHVTMRSGRKWLIVSVHQRRMGPPLSDEYHRSGKKLRVQRDTIKGLSVFYFQTENGVEILYRNDDTEYTIMMDGSIAQAVEIGNSLEAAIASGQA